MNKITFGFLLCFFSLLSYGQFTVSIPNMTVNGALATSVNFGTNVSSLTVTLSVEVSASSIQNDNSPAGDLTIYYKKNSSAPAIIPTGGSASTVLFLGLNKVTKPTSIILNSSQFDSTGGILYAEYKSSSNTSFVSANINITKNASSPPSSGGGGSSVEPLAFIYNMSPSADRVYIDGQNSPYATFEWQVKPLGGVWTTIPNETMWSCYNYNLTYQVSGTYRRIATIKRWWGDEKIVSNEVVVESISPPLQEISNNTISYSKENIIGSLPSGGNTYFAYEYYLYHLDGNGEIIEIYNVGEGKDLPIPVSNYLITKIYRKVYSGDKVSYSNTITVLPTQEITNNIITLSGTDILGNIPSGGNGNFLYQYYVYHEFPDGEIVDGVNMVGSDQNYSGVVQGYLTTKYYRKVISANKTSLSNTITILPFGSSAKATSNIAEFVATDLTVYPNPTSESINFATNFTTDKNIEIVLYSEKLGNEKSVYKGKVTPNQVINWSIPPNYQKGLYFYKILSDNKEVKSGKVIFN